jgi:ActD protein
MSKKLILGVYTDDYDIVEGAKKLRELGIKITQVWSPFPIHGIDPIIGVPRTRISMCSFLYGMTGTTLALLMFWYMMIHDWHIDIGGKPNFALYKNLPAFIPVTFESTVLCAAHGMFITFLLRSKILPGVTANNPDPRTTDDTFIMQIEVKDTDNMDQITNALKSTGATDIRM